jgi:hypothetical protein
MDDYKKQEAPYTTTTPTPTITTTPMNNNIQTTTSLLETILNLLDILQETALSSNKTNHYNNDRPTV